MVLWISILIIGLVCVVIGFAKFFKNLTAFKNKKKVFLIGTFLPLLLAYSYGENVISDASLKFTLIDLGGLLVLAIISGIFISCYFLVDRV